MSFIGYQRRSLAGPRWGGHNYGKRAFYRRDRFVASLLNSQLRSLTGARSFSIVSIRWPQRRLFSAGNLTSFARFVRVFLRCYFFPSLSLSLLSLLFFFLPFHFLSIEKRERKRETSLGHHLSLITASLLASLTSPATINLENEHGVELYPPSPLLSVCGSALSAVTRY